MMINSIPYIYTLNNPELNGEDLFPTKEIREESKHKLTNDGPGRGPDFEGRVLGAGQLTSLGEVCVSHHDICEIDSENVVCVCVESGTRYQNRPNGKSLNSLDGYIPNMIPRKLGTVHLFQSEISIFENRVARIHRIVKIHCGVVSCHRAVSFRRVLSFHSLLC